MRAHFVFFAKKRKATPVSATPTHTLRVCVNSSFELFLCRLAATGANTLPRQSDHRLNRKRGSNPRLTRTFACSDLIYSHPDSMSIKPCSHSRSLAYSGKCSYGFGVAPPTPSNLLAFCGRYVRTRGMEVVSRRDRQKFFDLPSIAHTCCALLPAADSTGCEVVCKGGRGAFL